VSGPAAPVAGEESAFEFVIIVVPLVDSGISGPTIDKSFALAEEPFIGSRPGHPNVRKRKRKRRHHVV
jgi:hypothetical protein